MLNGELLQSSLVDHDQKHDLEKNQKHDIDQLMPDLCGSDQKQGHTLFDQDEQDDYCGICLQPFVEGESLKALQCSKEKSQVGRDGDGGDRRE